MTLDFSNPITNIGGDSYKENKPLHFGDFVLGNPSAPSPGWQDVTVSGNNYITLPNAKANGLNYLKLFGGCEQRGVLPSGYTQLEYISTGDTIGPFIHLDLQPNANSILEARLTTLDTFTQAIVPTASNYGKNLRICKFSASGKVGGSVGTTNYDSSYDGSTPVTIRVDHKKVYANGQLIGDGSENELSTSYSEINLFRGMYSTMNYSKKLSMYYAYISVDGINPDFFGIPALRNSDNIAGFYDIVNNTFYPSGDEQKPFVAGTVVNYPLPYIPYTIWCNNGMLKVNAQGQIYTDGTVETIQITGKNLFNTEGSTYNKYIDSSGDEQVSSNFAYTDYIRVYPNTTYTFAVSQVFENRGNNHRVFGYDANKTFIGQEANVAIAASKEKGARESGTFTTGSTTEYLRLNYIYDPDGEQPQLEFGSTATTYEPYFNGDTAAAENLLSISTYKDVQSVIDGDIKRNIGVKVLDGSETWVQYPNSTTYYSDDAITDNKLSVMANMLLCTHYAPTVGSPMPENTIRFRMDNSLKVLSNRLYIADTINSTLAGWKAWLAQQYAAGTPVVVIFPLATEATETTTSQTLTLQQGTNTISITQASIDPLSLEANYKAGVEVTIEEIENANLDNNVTVTID